MALTQQSLVLILGVMYRGFPLTNEIIHGEFGAIEHLTDNTLLDRHLPCFIEINVF